MTEIASARIDPAAKAGFYTNCFECGLWYHTQAIVRHYGLRPVYLSRREAETPVNPSEFPLDRITYNMELVPWLQRHDLDVFFAFEGNLRIGQQAKRNVPHTVDLVNWELVDPREIAKLADYWDELWFSTKEPARYFTDYHRHVRLMRGVDWAPGVRFLPKDYDGTVYFYHNCGAGGIHGRKNTAAVIQAFEGALRERPGMRLRVTAQKEFPYLRTSCEAITITTRTLSRQELLQCYADAHIVVQPSKREGFGLPLYEALKAGCGVITTDCAPMNELGDRDNVWYVPVVGYEGDFNSLIPLVKVDTLDVEESILEAADFVEGGLLEGTAR